MKQAIRLSIGWLVYVSWRLLRPARLRGTQERFFASHALSFAERQLLAYLMFRARTDPAAAYAQWAGDAGNRFHSHNDHRLTLDIVLADEFYRRPMLDPFATRAAQALRPGAVIAEVGCGAGGNLLYLSQLLADHGYHFLGLDINREVIESNQGHASADLRFEQRDCFTSELTVPGDLGLIFCAVLMYAQEPDIVRLLRGVTVNNRGRILLGLSEPVLDPQALHARPHNNFGLLHGYRRILRQLRFRPLFEDFRQEQGKAARIYHAVFEFPREDAQMDPGATR